MIIENINLLLNNIKNDKYTGVKIVSVTGNESTSVFAIELAPGQTIPSHYHKSGIEMYFILSGIGIIHIGHLNNEKLIWCQHFNVLEGDCFSIQPNEVHKFENKSANLLRLLAIAPLTHNTDEDRFFVM